MVIDFHSHLYNIEKAEESLIEVAKKLRYEKIVLCGIEGNYWTYILENEYVLNIYKKYPDLIIPFAHFRLGIDKKEKIDEFLKNGFKGIKFIGPIMMMKNIFLYMKKWKKKI